MKNRHLLLLILLLSGLETFAQFKGAVLKKWNTASKPGVLKLFEVTPPANVQDAYLMHGKIPGKAELGILLTDRSDKLSFRSLARYWSRSENVRKGDEVAMKLIAREYNAPKGYEGILQKDRFHMLNESEILYYKEFRKGYNMKEQDSIEMVEITYIALHPEMKNQIIAFDLFVIGTELNTDSIESAAKTYIDGIRPIHSMFNKKWTVETNFNALFGGAQVATNLDYVKQNFDGSSSYYYITLRPGNLSGTSIGLSRNLKRNYLIYGKAGFFDGPSQHYDSLFKKLGYYSPPILFDVTFSATTMGFGQLGIEKRFYMGKRHSFSVMADLRYSFGNPAFKMTCRITPTGVLDEHKLQYRNAAGFDLGGLYRFYFGHQHWGLHAGFEYMYTRFELDKYLVNGQERSISEAPYFLPSIRSYDISGMEILFGGFFQF